MLRSFAACLALSMCVVGAAATPPSDDVFQKGYALGKAGDFAAALPLIRQAANAGHVEAQYVLGSMYSRGQGVTESKSEARSWYEKAGAKNHPDALFNLGLFYDRGVGVAQDRKRALGYYKRSGDAGSGQGAFNAGQMLVTGDGVAADPAAGMRFIGLAAKKNIAQAQLAMGYAHEKGIGVARSAEQALDQYALAEKNGLDAGDRRIMLSRKVTEEGLALERDKHGVQALRFFDLSCKYGEYHGCYNAGRLRDHGKAGVARDRARALADYRIACAWAVPWACRGVAGLVIGGAQATPKDIATTKTYLAEQCKAGDQQMCYNLAWTKTQARFGPVDRAGAQKLLAQACFNHGYKPACQPHADMHNASLPQQRSGGGGGRVSGFEQGILDFLGVLGGGLAAIGSAGSYSSGSYAGYSSYAPSSTTSPTSRFQAEADYRQFISTVSSYGSSKSCRPGNPYC